MFSGGVQSAAAGFVAVACAGVPSGRRQTGAWRATTPAHRAEALGYADKGHLRGLFAKQYVAPSEQGGDESYGGKRDSQPGCPSAVNMC
jgi:hypothetical protein